MCDVLTEIKMNLKLGIIFLCPGVFFKLVFANVVDNSIQTGRTFDASSILSSLATKFMSRGYGASAPGGIGMGGSQLVTFNLQNLLCLVLLKVVIFAAASLAGGHHKDGYGRTVENEEEKFITDEELLMFLSFLSGSPKCLQNIACQQPQQAKKYVAAGDLLLKAAKIFSFNGDFNYENIIQEMDQAANVGLVGDNCSRFECGTQQI